MKPSIPKGTRDFSPEQINKRNFIFDQLRKVFVTCAYQPVETPAMESLSTLTGKYGEEGDRLLFKVLNNGDFLAKADQDALLQKDSNRILSSIAKRGLRYDLTVPFARYVVMHRNDISFPFKRYQIQPVWRADRPQKGRYQEFYQCDVDVVGSNSLIYEAELAKIYDDAFTSLGLKVHIKINNRKVLAGIAEVAGIPEKLTEMTTALDKLDKIGMEAVKGEMEQRGIPPTALQKIAEILGKPQLDQLKSALKNSETGLTGVKELETVFGFFPPSSAQNALIFDPTLARGLDYYTGCIFEVIADPHAYPNLKMGSIGGGGRYDNLTAVFGLQDVSGVGVSFGAERIYDVMEELQLFPPSLNAGIPLIFVALDQKSHHFAFQILQQVRSAGIRADLYPEPVKLKKQMKYAHDQRATYVAVIGEEEQNSGKLALKNMHSGDQRNLSVVEIIQLLKHTSVDQHPDD